MMLSVSVNLAQLAHDKNVTVDYCKGNVISLSRYGWGPNVETSGEGTLFDNIQEAITLIQDMSI